MKARMWQGRPVTVTLWVKEDIGIASENLLKETLGKNIAAQALNPELFVPPTALGHNPSDVALGGCGYGEWALTREGEGGPIFDELKTALSIH
jgi:hypothetical protein